MGNRQHAHPRDARKLKHRAWVAEAAVLLLLAQALIRWVPLRWWRGSLGRPGAAVLAHETKFPGTAPQIEYDVRRAVYSACARLPVKLVCLPRAIAVQWMLRRRGLGSSLVIGVLPGTESKDGRHAFHAWVEREGRVLVGLHAERRYRRCTVLTQG